MNQKISTYIERTLAKRKNQDEPLRIVQTGHPALRAKAQPVTADISEDLLLELINAMVITMYDAPGVGVAAPQVGLPLSLVVMADEVKQADEEDNLYGRRTLNLKAVANPSYEAVAGTKMVYGWEGCLSVQGLRSIVPRPKEVRVRGTAYEADGTVHELDEVYSGWPARIFQHETDHINGVLCHDLCVNRSLVNENYLYRLADLHDAIRYLNLSGDITRLPKGAVELDSGNLS